MRRLLIAWLVATGCGEATPAALTGAAGTSLGDAGLAPDGGVTVPSAAHAVHTARFACVTCHDRHRGGGFQGSLPDGTPITGTMTGSSPTYCTVSCHAPFGATPPPVRWDEGPLGCVRCHEQLWRPDAGVRSSHVASAAREACLGCHDVSEHLGGTPRFAFDGGVLGDAECQQCHTGAGRTLPGLSPPVLVGWTTADGGDWHGARAGAGHGGTLAAPHVRGEGPLSCRLCHAVHAAPSAFLIPRDAGVSRGGVGAEALCASCHLGERHAGCAGCHAQDPMPAGAPCLACHGHEGVVRFPPPVPPPRHDGTAQGDCTHCHGSWAPWVETRAPSLSNVKVTAAGTTSATVEWGTDEPATSWVELGAGERGIVQGKAEFVLGHRVSLTGLEPGTLYGYRAMSSDALRNQGRSAVLRFTTGSLAGPPAPAVVPEPDTWIFDAPFTATLEWSAVAAPDGHPVEYRVVVALSADFAQPYAQSGWIEAARFAVTLPGNAERTYHWYVVARDAVEHHESAWAFDEFATMWESW